MNNFFDDRKAKLEIYQKNYRGKKDAVAKVSIPDNIFKCPHCRNLLSKMIMNGILSFVEM